MESIGSFGTTPGQFSSPRAVAVGPKGIVAVADKTGRIQIQHGRGRPIAIWTMPKIDKGTPTGICFDHQGALLIADTHCHRVMRYSASGELLGQFGSYGEGPGQFIYPTDVAVAPNGDVYVAEYGIDDRIHHFSPSYEFLSTIGGHGSAPGKFRRPMGLVVDRSGFVYVADAVNHRIQKFTADGRFVAAWGEMGKGVGQLRYPYDVDLTPQGHIVVCEYGNHRLQRFTCDGESLGTFGAPGRSNQGRLASPWSVSVAPDGRTLVADTLNHRLLVLSQACPFDSLTP